MNIASRGKIGKPSALSIASQGRLGRLLDALASLLCNFGVTLGVPTTGARLNFPTGFHAVLSAPTGNATLEYPEGNATLEYPEGSQVEDSGSC